MITIDGRSLTVAEIVDVANRVSGLTLAPESIAQATSSYEFAEQAAAERPIYGRSTGVGANRTVAIGTAAIGTESIGAESIGAGAAAAAALGLLRSHATSAGELREPQRVRAMLAVRLNQLAAGGSGADPAVLTSLAAMIAADALPAVRELGSIGTGDLSALAVTALTLQGELPTRSVSGRLNPVPELHRFSLGDALPFMSSNAATLADAALGLSRLRELAESAIVVAALGFTAVDGNTEAFSSAVERATPFEGARRVCSSVRALTAQTNGAAPTPARIQDPFALRVFPQVHGALFDALTALDGIVMAMVNAASENPLLSPELGVAHHGSFYAASLAQSLDASTLALAQSAQLSLARLTMLAEPAFTGVASFLGDGTPGASGAMIVEYVAASALGSLRALAMPASLQSVTLSRGVEEDASFASLAARQALDATSLYRTVLACELVAAIRCIRLRSRSAGSASIGSTVPVVQAVLAGANEINPHLEDRDLTEDIAAAEKLLETFPDLLAQIMSSSGLSSSA
ncbi:aromatic amino acid ammonia-lyase [Jatrophihabitans sp. DSM 45814]